MLPLVKQRGDSSLSQSFTPIFAASKSFTLGALFTIYLPVMGYGPRIVLLARCFSLPYKTIVALFNLEIGCHRSMITAESIPRGYSAARLFSLPGCRGIHIDSFSPFLLPPFVVFRGPLHFTNLFFKTRLLSFSGLQGLLFRMAMSISIFIPCKEIVR